MKNHFVFPILAALALSSCDRPASDNAASSDSQTEENRAAIQAAADVLEGERTRLQAEREQLEAEKEQLRWQRESALAAKEQELSGLESELALQSERSPGSGGGLGGRTGGSGPS